MLLEINDYTVVFTVSTAPKKIHQMAFQKEDELHNILPSKLKYHETKNHTSAPHPNTDF